MLICIHETIRTTQTYQELLILVRFDCFMHLSIHSRLLHAKSKPDSDGKQVQCIQHHFLAAGTCCSATLTNLDNDVGLLNIREGRSLLTDYTLHV